MTPNVQEVAVLFKSPPPGQEESDSRRVGMGSPLFRHLGLAVVVLLVWYLVYRNLAPVSRWFTYDLLGLKAGRHLSAAVEFFVYEVPKVLLLLTLVVFGVGVVRSFFTPE